MPEYTDFAADSQMVTDYIASNEPVLDAVESGVLGAFGGALVGGVLVFAIIMWIIGIVLGILTLIGLWKMFTKAKEPGWAAIVPFYNAYVLVKIAGRPWWYFLLLFAAVIPFVGWIVAFVFGCIIMNDISKAFGKDIGTTIGLILLPGIFIPILGLGSAKYKKPVIVEKA